VAPSPRRWSIGYPTKETGTWPGAGAGAPEQKLLKAKRAIAARVVDARK
jgi:hypothetical protein